MDIRLAWIIAIAAYLLGSLSFTRIIARLVAPRASLTSVTLPVPGSGERFQVTSMGANTAGTVLGRRVGVLIGVLDMLKAAVPVLILRFIYPDQPYALIAATLVMVGHNWPIYHRFRGGRGYSAAYGGMLAIDPLGAILSALAGWVFGLLVLRNFIMVFLAGFWFYIPWMWFTTYNWWSLGYAIAVNVLFMLAMMPDIRQYRQITRETKVDLRTSMETSPMGKSALRLMERFHLIK